MIKKSSKEIIKKIYNCDCDLKINLNQTDEGIQSRWNDDFKEWDKKWKSFEEW